MVSLGQVLLEMIAAVGVVIVFVYYGAQMRKKKNQSKTEELK